MDSAIISVEWISMAYFLVNLVVVKKLCIRKMKEKFADYNASFLNKM